MHNSYLEFGYHVEDLLFKGLSINSVGGMIGLCLCVACFTFLYEFVKTMREKLASSLGSGNQTTTLNEFNTETSMLVEIQESHLQWQRFRVHSIHALLYMIQVTLGYMLMLIIMSYNAWLAITVFAAAGLSYYFFTAYVLHRPAVIPIEILPSGDLD